MATFSIDQVREQFPALQRTINGRPAIYFDGPGGSQMLEPAIAAMTAYMRRGGANLHGQFPSSHETEEHIAEAKLAMADLLAASPHEIAFGANATTLLFAISRALSHSWQPEDEIVVSEIDHSANVDSWLTAAADRGVKARWLSLDTQAMTLDLSRLDEVINQNTRLVAVGLASNAVGTINDLPRIAARAHEVGALVVVDAVHATPHISLDVKALGADILVCSLYKFFGPHIGVAYIREDIFEELPVYKLRPAPTHIPDKLETGTQNHEAIAAIAPVVDFLAGLGSGATRREKLITGYEAIEAYENAIADKIRAELGKIPGITIYQAGGRKTPTIGFTLRGLSPAQVCKWACDQYGVFVADGDFYATTMADKLGINKYGGWVRAGLAPYNTMEEADIFLTAMQDLERRVQEEK